MTTARQRRDKSNAKTEPASSSAFTGYEAELWRMADALRGSMDAAEYKHVVLGLIFLKYISMSSNSSGEGEIRKNIVEAGLVDCIIALPGQLFRSTQIPACLWFLRRGRGASEARPGETLFVYARKLGHITDRTHRDLSAGDISRIADTYRAWRGGGSAGDYADVPGFCKSATPEEIRRHGHVLTPGRYVGAAPQEDDGDPFQEKMARLVAQWREQQAEAQRLDTAIAENLERLGFGL